MKEDTEYKNIKVPSELHKRLKQQATGSGQSMIAYLSQCLASCKSSNKSEK